MAKIDDGGVKIVDYTVIANGNVIEVNVRSEHYENERYYITIPVGQNGEDPRTTIEEYFKGVGMMPTWSWSGNVGQFAAKRNYKCSEDFKFKG